MARGKLRIFLGAAPGVGKTYEMLQFGNRELRRGRDVVVGYLETHGRKATADQVGDLDVLPRRTIEHRGATFTEMDVDAVRARAPDIALVDEYAHTNVPGSRNAKRWQDIDELLDAGIDVVSTVNIQHLESLNDVVEQITGVAQRETVPDARVRAASQIDLVDLPPESIRARLARGLIYDAAKIDAALGNFFRPGNLGALRELALLWLADRVDESLDQYKRDHDIAEPWETRERVLVALTGAPHADRVIRRAARIATRTRGALLGVHVISQDGLARPEAPRLAEHRALIEQLGGTFIEVVGDDPAEALLAVARSERVTQLVLGATRRTRWQELISGSIVNQVLRGAGQVDVHVISSDAGSSREDPRATTGRRLRGLSRRRRSLGLVAGLGGLALLTSLLEPARPELELASVMLLYLAVTVVASAIGGLTAGLVTGLLAFAIADFYFTLPLREWTVADARVVIALVVFMLVAIVVSVLVDVAARRANEATRARAEATALSDLARVLLDSDRPLEQLVDHIRVTLGLRAVALLRRGEHGWVVEASSGTPELTAPDDAADSVDVPPDHLLAIDGPQTLAEDRSVLAAFAAQAGVALESRALAQAAASAGAFEQARNLRDALLAAVSHDLRTPLATMKAAATSLQQTDVELSPADRDEFVATIVTQTDRLNALVGNLLDMSRIHSGALDVRVLPVGLEEVVPAAIRSLPAGHERIEVDVPESLPHVLADPGLLERIVANLLANAVKWSPARGRVRVVAGVVPDGVDLRIVDRGPGIAPEDRARVFEPFQRTGDRTSVLGTGLGLAVARGFAEAIGGTIAVDDTPGGGTTMVVHLPVAPPPAAAVGERPPADIPTHGAR